MCSCKTEKTTFKNNKLFNSQKLAEFVDYFDLTEGNVFSPERVDKMTDATTEEKNFIEILWNAKLDTIKKATLDNINDLETLIRIVLANEDEEFSLRALNKIKVEKCLFKIYEQGISEKISVRAVSLIKNQKLLTDIARKEESWRVREAAVKKIVSKKVLREISMNDENEYVRNVAKKRMNL